MVFFIGLFGGQQVHTVHAAAQDAEKHRQQGILPAQKQPGGCHQLDIAAAERTVNGKAEQKHRHADADCTDDMPPPPGGGEHRAGHAADRQREIQPIGDGLRLGIDERNA